MATSPLAKGNRLALGFYHSGGKKLRRYMPRNAKISGMVFHHIVGDVDSLQRELLKTSRTLSVNYGISRQGIIHPCVPEEFKANTTSHSIDHSRITVETANETLAPNYKISDASFDAAARLAADCGHRYGFVPSAKTIGFHRQYVATACPGPDFWGRKDEFIALARKYYDGGTAVVPKPSTPEKTSDGLPAAGVAMLAGARIGDIVRITDWALFNDPGQQTGKRFVSGDYKIAGISYKYRGGVEPSLLLEDSRGNKAWAHYSAVKGLQRSGSSAPSKPAPSRLSVGTLADQVLQGKWGNGAERKHRLQAEGYDYGAVQAEVTRRQHTQRRPSIAQMASEVIAGKHGSGHTNRQRSLGIDSATYAKVRAEVNRRV